jgi:hypothetical protein
MRRLALLVGGALGVFGLALILSAVGSEAGLGPPELIIGLFAIAIGVLLVLSTRR